MKSSVPYEFEMRSIDSLKPHPLNSKAFDEVEDDDFEALVRDIDARGLQNEPDILPEGDLILAGHRRIRACGRLGHQEIRCRVRYDMAGATDADIVVALINDNLHRRQLSKLGIARALRARMQALDAEQGNSYSSTMDLIGPLASALNVSERNARRYLRALTTPQAVQHALEQGALPLVLADKVAGLPAKLQQQVATRIERGESAKTVVASVLNKPKGGSAAGKEQVVPVGQLIIGAEAWTKEIVAGKWLPPSQRLALTKSTKGLLEALKTARRA
jgi:ParB-like chromosome segregation protein Spo0J